MKNMRSFSYGGYVVGWMPCETMWSGGRFMFFKDGNEYEAAFKKNEKPHVEKKSIEQMLSAAEAQEDETEFPGAAQEDFTKEVGQPPEYSSYWIDVNGNVKIDLQLDGEKMISISYEVNSITGKGSNLTSHEAVDFSK